MKNESREPGSVWSRDRKPGETDTLAGSRIVQRCPGLDETLKISPGLYRCPLCGAEVEIWSDERTGRCPRCGTRQARGDFLDQHVHGKLPRMVAVKECQGPNCTLFFEKHEAMVDLNQIQVSDPHKFGCAECKRFGRNLACPPFSPAFSQYTEGHAFARIICIRMPQEYFPETAGRERYRECFRAARKILTGELLNMRRLGFVVLGSGPCLACSACVAEKKLQECMQPESLVYSLESLRVNIIRLVKDSFGIDLEWSADDADFQCAVGGVFIRKQIRWKPY